MAWSINFSSRSIAAEKVFTSAVARHTVRTVSVATVTPLFCPVLFLKHLATVVLLPSGALGYAVVCDASFVGAAVSCTKA